jgi:hypothetical protein
MKTLNNSLIRLSLFLGLILVWSCEEDTEDPNFANPTLSLSSDASIEVQAGETFTVNLTFTAEGGAKELVVYQGGGVLEVVPLAETATTVAYSNQSVPTDAIEGQEFSYEFAVVSQQDVESNRVAVTVSALTFPEISVGGQRIFEVSPPSDGVLPSGTAIKFVTGRNYLIRGSISFSTGTSLEIEEGVQVYLDANAENPVEVEIGPGATTSILGTAENPVVMTSSSTLDGTPAPGDWDTFRLEESVNSTIQYLRIEFSGEGMRVQRADDSNDISYVQVMNTANEGFYITGGAATFSHLYALNASEGGYRIGDDYSGKMQYLISQLSEYIDEATELEIRETASPTISNVTLIGPGTDTENTHGIRLRSASAAKVYNAVVAQFPRRGLRMNDEIVVTDLDGPTVFAYSYIFDVPTDPYRDDTENGNPFQGFIDPDNGFQNPFFNNVTDLEDNEPVLISIAGIGINSFIPDSRTESDFDPSSLDPFFEASNFAGAVADSGSDWTLGWSKNPDGSIRQ